MTERQQDRRREAQLAEQLLRGGVGLRYVRRTLRELRDHRDDLSRHMLAQGDDPVAAARGAHQLLGDQDELVSRMIGQPELRSRARRFAWLLFVLGPTPATFIALLLVVFALQAVPAVLNVVGFPAIGRNDLELETTLTRMSLQWMSPAIVGMFLCRAAVQRRIPGIWPVCALAMASLGSACTHISGTQRVTGIYFGWFPSPDMTRAAMLFCACGLAYLLMRRGPHAI